MSHVWVLTRKLWRKLEAAMPKGVEVRGHPLTTAMGDEQGKEVPLEAGMECTVAPGSPEATCMPCAVVIAEDNDVFDCQVLKFSRTSSPIRECRLSLACLLAQLHEFSLRLVDFLLRGGELRL